MSTVYLDLNSLPTPAVTYRNGVYLVKNFSNMEIIRDYDRFINLGHSKLKSKRPFTLDLYEGGLEPCCLLGTAYFLSDSKLESIKYVPEEGFKFICAFSLYPATHQNLPINLIEPLERVLEIELTQTGE